MKNSLRNLIPLSLLLLSAFLFRSCLEPEIYALDFYSVSMNDPSPTAEFGSVKLVGTVDNNALSALKNQGFLLAENEEALSNNTGEQLIASLEQGGTFTYQLENLDLEKTYYLKSFAVFADDRTDGQRTVYSENSWPFSLGIMLITNQETTVTNDEVIVSGSITGLQRLGIDVAAHGFIYSAASGAQLTLDEVNGMSDTIDLGLLNDESPFVSILKSLDLNTSYQFRTWAVNSTGEEFYSDQIRSFETLDGWKLLQEGGFQLVNGFGSVINDQAYFLGCSDCCPLQNCSGTGAQTLYKYDLNDGSWSDSQTQLPFFSRYNGISFSIGDSLYFGMGFSDFVVNDLYKIHVNDIGSENMQPVAGANAIGGRQGAVAFVVNDKAYVGTGKNLNGDYINDFWEYDPLSGHWRAIAKLPRQLSATASVELNGSRSESLAFVINGNA